VVFGFPLEFRVPVVQELPSTLFPARNLDCGTSQPRTIFPELQFQPSLDLQSESDPNDPVPQTPKLNRDIPADHRNEAIGGDTTEKGWTGESAEAAVTDSVGISGDESGVERLVRDIGPGSFCNLYRDVCQ